MYKEKNMTSAIIAILYFIAMMFGYYFMGVLYKSGNKYFSGVQWLFLIIAVLIVLIKDKSFSNLGFTKEKIKSNLLVAAIIVAASIGFAFLYTDISAAVIVKAASYYLFYVALLEEVIFRGFMQNYLFGLRLNRKIIYAIGAVFFCLGAFAVSDVCKRHGFFFVYHYRDSAIDIYLFTASCDVFYHI